MIRPLSGCRNSGACATGANWTDSRPFSGWWNNRVSTHSGSQRAAPHDMPSTRHVSVGVDFDDRLGELPWRFLRKVVPDAALDDSVSVFT